MLWMQILLPRSKFLSNQMFCSLATKETFLLVSSASPGRCFLALHVLQFACLAMFSSLAI